MFNLVLPLLKIIELPTMKKLLTVLAFVPFALLGQEESPCYSVLDLFQEINYSSSQSRDFQQGWSIFGYSCQYEQDFQDVFAFVLEDIIIIKDFLGSAYIPQYSFNSLGNLKLMEGYQIKTSALISNFELCQLVSYPIIYGCIDCESDNFNPFATSDDGSCDYGWRCGMLPSGGAVAEQVSMPTGCMPGTSTDPGVFSSEGFCLSQNTNIPNGCGGTSMGALVKPTDIEPKKADIKGADPEVTDPQIDRMQKIANIKKER